MILGNTKLFSTIVFLALLSMFCVSGIIAKPAKAEISITPHGLSIEVETGRKYERKVRLLRDRTEKKSDVILRITPEIFASVVRIDGSYLREFKAGEKEIMIDLIIYVPADKTDIKDKYYGDLIVKEGYYEVGPKQLTESKMHIEFDVVSGKTNKLNENNLPRCKDSDNGSDFYTKGSASGVIYKNGTYEAKILTDKCIEDNRLVEYYCDNSRQGYIISKEYPCVLGCEDGACKKGDIANTAINKDINKSQTANKRSDAKSDSILSELSNKALLERAQKKQKNGLNWSGLLFILLGLFIKRYAKKTHREVGGVSYRERSLGKFLVILGIIILFI